MAATWDTAHAIKDNFLHHDCNTVSDLVSETFFLCMLDANSFSCGDHGHLALSIIHLFNQLPLLMLEGGP